jgi:DNA-binding PadR family transcriptional regulator
VPIQHAVLSLLSDGPAHGYRLKSDFEHAIGPQWGRLNIGHLYQTLDRLAREGHVVSERVPGDSRPDRRVYRLTESGDAELARWLNEPAERATGYRDELFFKLLAASRAGAAAVQGVVHRQRAYQLGQLATLVQLRGAHDDEPLVQLLVDAARLHTEADLALLDLTEDRIEQLATLTAREVTPAGADSSAKSRSA